MPLFYKLKLFFIHIPKTGGTSVEDFLYKKTNTRKTIDTFFSGNCSVRLNKHTLQHSTYEELIKCSNNLNFNIKKLKVFAVVRNPYDRIVSELFYIGKINIDSNEKFVEEKIIDFLNDDYHYDNHKLPQYKFVTHKGTLVQKITIMKNEHLNDNMYNYGFKDFDENANKTHRGKINYIDMLSDKAKNLIYNYYKKDFELFDYDK
jgi:hypothetical protein